MLLSLKKYTKKLKIDFFFFSNVKREKEIISFLINEMETIIFSIYR